MQVFVGLVIGDLASLALILWVFDSKAAHSLIGVGMSVFTVTVLFRLAAIRRRETANDH